MQVNEFVKRVRAAKIHILIMGHLRKQMPAMMGKQKAQEKLLRNLPEHFSFVQREYHLPVGEWLALEPDMSAPCWLHAWRASAVCSVSISLSVCAMCFT